MSALRVRALHVVSLRAMSWYVRCVGVAHHVIVCISWVRLACSCFVELQESNVGLRLTIVDTVGYGDQIDKTARFEWNEIICD